MTLESFVSRDIPATFINGIERVRNSPDSHPEKVLDEKSRTFCCRPIQYSRAELRTVCRNVPEWELFSQFGQNLRDHAQLQRE